MIRKLKTFQTGLESSLVRPFTLPVLFKIGAELLGQQDPTRRSNCGNQPSSYQLRAVQQGIFFLINRTMVPFDKCRNSIAVQVQETDTRSKVSSLSLFEFITMFRRAQWIIHAIKWYSCNTPPTILQSFYWKDHGTPFCDSNNPSFEEFSTGFSLGPIYSPQPVDVWRPPHSCNSVDRPRTPTILHNVAKKISFLHAEQDKLLSPR